MKPDPQKLKALTEMPPPKTKKDLQAFLGIINYSSNFSPSTADVYESLRQLTSNKTEWTWNATYQKQFDKAKSLITEDVCMKPSCCTWNLWNQTWCCPTIHQKWYKLHNRQSTRNSICRPIIFASKSLSSAERRYSNMEREALGILQGIKKFHHYCFAREVSIIIDCKLLVAIFKKDVAMLFQKIQQILLRIQQYRVKIIYKPGPDLFLVDWLSRQNHKENKDKEIPGMQLNVDAIETTTNIPDCMKIQQLQQTHKMIIYNRTKILSSEDGQRTKIKYHKTDKHSGHFKMIWQ